MPLAGDTTLDNYIFELTSKVKNIDKYIDDLVNKSVDNDNWTTPKGYILKSIKVRLWNKGMDGDKVLIQSKIPADKQEGSRKYRLKKRKKGYRSEPTNLRVKGNFYRSFVVTSKRGVISVDSKTNAENPKHKVDNLFGKFGENILSLTKEEQQEFLDRYILKNVADWISKNGNPTILKL